MPEEAALPIVAWLLEHEQFEATLDLVSELRPWMDRLRFTPRLAAEPRPSRAMIRVRTADVIAAAMTGMKPRPQIAVMHETRAVWHPLFDRLTTWCAIRLLGRSG